MSSETDIANSALARLGAEPILDIGDTTKTSGRTMAAQFPIARDKLLRSYRWAFAMKRASLPADSDAPAWGFNFQYTLPADYLSIDLVGETYVGLDLSDYRNSDAAEFQVESGKLLTNLGAPLPIRYVRRVDEPGLFDPIFTDLLALQLALDCCEKITQSTSKRESLKGDYTAAVKNAVRCNAIERPPQPLPDDSWIIARA